MTWSYPGPENRGENWTPQCSQPRWAKPEWKSLAWATQLLAALDAFFVVMVKASLLSDVVWWFAIVTTVLVLILVSVLAVK